MTVQQQYIGCAETQYPPVVFSAKETQPTLNLQYLGTQWLTT